MRKSGQGVKHQRSRPTVPRHRPCLRPYPIDLAAGCQDGFQHKADIGIGRKVVASSARSPERVSEHINLDEEMGQGQVSQATAAAARLRRRGRPSPPRTSRFSFSLMRPI